MSRIRRLAMEGGWIVLGQAASVIGSLILVRVLTGRLDPAQYGKLALALTLGTLVCQVAFAGVTPGIMRYYTIAAENGKAQGYFSASLRMVLYGTCGALGLGFVLLAVYGMTGEFDWLGLVSISIAFTILGNYNTTLSMIQNAARQRRVAAFHGALDAWLKILFAVLLCYLIGKTPVAIVLGYVISLLIVLLSQFLFIHRLIPRTDVGGIDHDQWVSKIWSYSKPFVFLNMFTWLQSSSDRWALDVFATKWDVGMYSVLMQLGYAPITIMTGLVVTYISPILFQRSGDATEPARNKHASRLAWQVTFIALIFTVIGSILAAIFHVWIFKRLVTSEYRTVSYLLPWMVLAGGMYSAGQVLSLKLMSDLNTTSLIAPKIITAIVGAFLSFSGAYIAGFNGVIFATVIFSAIHLIWIALISRHERLS